MERIPDGEGEVLASKACVKGRRLIQNEKKIDLFTLISFLFCISFYMFFAVFDGAVICADTPSYINMHSSREPLYPILLATFRWLFQGFSNNFYLNMIAVLQSFLMAISVFSMEEYMRKNFKFPNGALC